MRNPNYPGDRNVLLDTYMQAKATRYTWGFIDSIDINNGFMNVRIAQTKILKNIIINQGACGPYHGIRAMPRKKDFVLLGIEYDNNMFHLATMPFKQFQWFENTIQTNQNVPAGNLLMRKLKEGETEISACDENGLQACSIALLQDGTVETNSKNGVERIDSNGMEKDSSLLTMKMDKSRLIVGNVTRKNANGDMEIKTIDGATYKGVGDALQEVKIAINQNIDPSTGDDLGDPVIKVHLSDEILDDNGVPVLDQNNRKLLANIVFQSGLVITVNQDGELRASQDVGSSITMKSNGDVIIHATNNVRLDASQAINQGVFLGGSGGYIVTSPTPGQLIFQEGYILTAQPNIRG